MAIAEEIGLLKAFKLQTSISTVRTNPSHSQQQRQQQQRICSSRSAAQPHPFTVCCVCQLNMHLFDASGHIARYASPLAIIDAYFPVRLALYHSRRTALLDSLTGLLRRLHNRSRFISSLTSSAIVLHRRRRGDIEQELQQAGYDRLQEEGGAGGGGFGYLLDQKLSALTEEEMLRLEKEKQRVEREVAELKSRTAEQLWLADLDRLELSLQRLLSRDGERTANGRRTPSAAAEADELEDAEGDDAPASPQAAGTGAVKEVKRRVMTATGKQ